MPRFLISGFGTIDYENELEIEADTQEEAEGIFNMDFFASSPFPVDSYVEIDEVTILDDDE